MNNGFEMSMQRALDRYTAAIRACDSLPELVQYMRITAPSVREWLRTRIETLPADCKPQWVLDAAKPGTPRDRAKAAKRHIRGVQKQVKGAFHQAKTIEGISPPAKISLSMPPFVIPPP